MFQFFKIPVPLFSIVLSILATVPATGESLEALKQSLKMQVDQINAKARMRGDELLVALKNTRCDNGSDTSAVLEYEAFAGQMMLADMTTAGVERTLESLQRSRES